MFNECLEIRWKIAHFCFLNFSRPIISFCLRSNIEHSTQCFITRWNTSKFVKNTQLRVVFSTLFSVFHLVMKHYVSCLIYYFTNNAPSKHFLIWSTNYQYVCRVLCVKNVCNENSRLTSNNGPNVHQKPRACKTNGSSRQSRCVVTAKLRMHCSS